MVENGLAVLNISNILKTQVISVCETTEQDPYLLFKNAVDI